MLYRMLISYTWNTCDEAKHDRTIAALDIVAAAYDGIVFSGCMYL